MRVSQFSRDHSMGTRKSSRNLSICRGLSEGSMVMMSLKVGGKDFKVVPEVRTYLTDIKMSL